MKSPPAVALFDLDGTLIDSVPDIAVALNAGLEQHGYPALEESSVRGFMGGGAALLVRRALAQSHGDDIPQQAEGAVLDAFGEFYGHTYFCRSSLYPGAKSTLGELAARGWRVGCVTNKPQPFARPILAAAGLLDYFDAVIAGGDVARQKPAPDPLLAGRDACGGTTANTVYVGDSAIDVDAAAAAGMVMIAVTHGYHGGIDLLERGATRLVNRLDEIPDLADSLLPSA